MAESRSLEPSWRRRLKAREIKEKKKKGKSETGGMVVQTEVGEVVGFWDISKAESRIGWRPDEG